MKFALIVFSLLLLSCNGEQSTTVDQPVIVDSLAALYPEEYKVARMSYYRGMYNLHCLELLCGQELVKEKIPMYKFTVQPDQDFVKNHSEDFPPSDTITFVFDSKLNDSCRCIYAERSSLRSVIRVKRGTAKICQIGDGATMLNFGDDMFEMEMRDTAMLNYVKNNRQLVPGWYYNELLERGYLR